MFLQYFKDRFGPQKEVVGSDQIAKLETLILAGIIIADHEAYMPVAYHATADERRRNIYTVGFGETQGVGAGDRMSYATACYKLKDKLSGLVDQLRGWKPDLFTAFTPAQVAAIVSLLYNVGEGNFTGGATYQAFLRGDVKGMLENGFDKERGFVKQSGKILKGLVERREKESTLLLTLASN